jgi:hypothetical protein
MPEVSRPQAQERLSWTEYKTVRQYQTMGDLLEEFRAYGCRDVKRTVTEEEDNEMNSTRNGHLWLTKDP